MARPWEPRFSYAEKVCPRCKDVLPGFSYRSGRWMRDVCSACSWKKLQGTPSGRKRIERFKQERRERQLSHPELVREKGRDYYGRNAEKVKESRRSYVQSNPDKIRVLRKRWAEENPQKWSLIHKISHANRDHLKRGTSDGSITKDFLVDLFSTENCYYCEAHTPMDDRTMDHMLPLSRGGAHSVRNVVMSCSMCNSRKGTKTHLEYFTYLSEVS